MPSDFLIFNHAFDDPDLYGPLSFFETMSVTVMPSLLGLSRARHASLLLRHGCRKLHKATGLCEWAFVCGNMDDKLQMRGLLRPSGHT